MSDFTPHTTQTGAGQTQLWQKVSPWALVYFVVHFGVRFVRDGIFNLLPLGFVFVTQVENKLFWGANCSSSGCKCFAFILGFILQKL
ncbi:hypothetical protein ATS73_014130 [Pseudoalteromonas sp. H100]|nr:hypothetical protein [Pseudoalteromonas sp. H100]WFO19104.1 hypothetical protein ATS73_014130 [Pseudoalteromonas sp. H100]